MDIYVPQQHLSSVKLYLKEHGIEHEVSIPDVGELISEQARSVIGIQQDDEMTWDVYHRYDTVTRSLKMITMTYGSCNQLFYD